jgi:hypothetical protein
VVQLWDPERRISTALRDGMRSHPTAIPIARRRTNADESGILWDAVALFSPTARWDDTLPAPEYLDGDVVDVIGQLARRLKTPSM